MKFGVGIKFCSKSKRAVVLVLTALLPCMRVNSEDSLISTATMFTPKPSASSFFAPSDDFASLMFTPPKIDTLPETLIAEEIEKELTLIGLVAGIIVDISYGIIDPRIRMGAK